MIKENYPGIDYRFKIIAKIKDDISDEEKKEVKEKINYLKQLLDIYQINDETYIRIRKNNRDFASGCGFYVQLEKTKNYFSKLEYYDYIDDEMEIAV